jgi:biopolymer transport protein ExbB
MSYRKPVSRGGPIALLVVGVLLAAGPLWGLLGTMVGMIGAFGELSRSGGPDPQGLASHITVSLWTTMAGILVMPVGVALTVVACIWLQRVNRERRVQDGSVMP